MFLLFGYKSGTGIATSRTIRRQYHVGRYQISGCFNRQYYMVLVKIGESLDTSSGTAEAARCLGPQPVDRDVRMALS